MIPILVPLNGFGPSVRDVLTSVTIVEYHVHAFLISCECRIEIEYLSAISETPGKSSVQDATNLRLGTHSTR